jgi:hypothetical protein
LVNQAYFSLMSLVLDHIAESILPQITGNSDVEKWEACSKEYPWYPTPWLALAKAGDGVAAKKAGLWLDDNHRLQFILQPDSSLDINPSIPEYIGKAVVEEPAPEVFPTDPNEIFLKEEEEITSQSNGHLQSRANETLSFTLQGGFEQEEETDEERDANSTDWVEDEQEEKNKPELNFELKIDKQPVTDNIKSELAGSLVKSIEAESPKLDTIDDTKKADVAIPKPVIPESSANEPLAFEPYHVVDYFASQGIKVDINDLPKTQLDRQMKSFTQWLKTMKRVVPQESSAVSDPVVDAQATTSLIKEDIITEAMAEVLEKQGMNKKAIEVYEKLILLYPEKSTFFATRIKDLKSR